MNGRGCATLILNAIMRNSTTRVESTLGLAIMNNQSKVSQQQQRQEQVDEEEQEAEGLVCGV